MTVTFRPAVRAAIPLLLGVAGGTGSGKTFSALRLARGIAQGKPFAAIDTENGRMLHYADLFPEMQHASIRAPFRPAAYADAIESADKQGFPVIVVDSASHEWAGDGGCLDWHDELMGGDQKKNLSAWILPKRDHKAMVTRLLQVKAHVILAFRAEPKVESIRENGQTKIVAKQSLTGLDGWLPISEKMLPYELTASFLLMADKPGYPKPIKLQEQHRGLVPLGEPLSEETGARLAAWAAGGAALGESGAGVSAPETDSASSAVSPGPDPAGAPDSPSVATLAEPVNRAGEDAGGRAGQSPGGAGSASADVEIATAAQQGLIHAKAKAAGLDDDARHELIDRVTGQPSTRLVPKAMVNAVLDEIAAHVPVAS